jgi:hypothetical protein
LFLVRALRFAFGMMFCVGIGLSKRCFQACSTLLDSRKLPLRIVWSGLMVPSSGIFSSLGCFMIGRWRSWPCFIGACMLVS